MKKKGSFFGIMQIIWFLCFIFQLQCIAKIYDIYEKDVVKYIDEYYPQILANSENGGVHFSFISDRDAAGEHCYII